LRLVHQKEDHVHGDWLRDVILGGQDGLVNVLGIVLGVSAANGSGQIVITASLAAAFAEAVSMAAVAYTSALAEKDHYEKELERETQEMKTVPDTERSEVREIYVKKGFSGKLLDETVSTLTRNPDVWLKTMMEEELFLRPVETKSILKTSLIVGVAALLASFIPILPFVLFSRSEATLVSLIVSGTALFIVGVYEAKTYVGCWWKNGLQMVTIGLGAALAGFVIGSVFKIQPR